MKNLQPQVDEKGRVKGAETLVRWIRPDGSVVPPGKFLSVLERSELIATMDLHIWELAVKQLAKWRNTEFHDLYLSVKHRSQGFLLRGRAGSAQRAVRQVRRQPRTTSARDPAASAC